jgi:hypothetical protein
MGKSKKSMDDFIQILKIFCLNAKSLSAEVLKKREFLNTPIINEITISLS